MDLTEEDIKFLKELAHELKTQDRRGTNKPVLYQISDIDVIWSDNSEDYDDVKIMLDYEFLETEEEMKKYILDNFEEFEMSYHYLDNEKDLIEDDINNLDIDEIINMFEEANYTILYAHNHKKTRGAFLTKRSAEEHLKENSHHYSQNAKVYVDYAWRNPELKKLLEIIEKFDN